MDTLGLNLKKYREYNTLTQQQLADYLECQREIISYYENGTRTPNVEILQKISDLFGIELDKLLEESSEIVDENLMLAFRQESSNPADLKEIASFKKIIKNYLKMNRILTEHGL